MNIWTCKIGEAETLTDAPDGPMRLAVAAACRKVTGAEPEFLFSGWGGKLDECECAVVENRLPDPTKDVPQAFEVLKTAMQMDPGYAWSWHCNIAVSMQDEGAPHDWANAGAARFMQLCFGVDTKNPPTAPGVAER